MLSVSFVEYLSLGAATGENPIQFKNRLLWQLRGSREKERQSECLNVIYRGNVPFDAVAS